jgi:hypothetical protein
MVFVGQCNERKWEHDEATSGALQGESLGAMQCNAMNEHAKLMKKRQKKKLHEESLGLM